MIWESNVGVQQNCFNLWIEIFFCQPLKLKKGIEYLTNSLEIYETYDQNKINKLEIEIYVF